MLAYLTLEHQHLEKVGAEPEHSNKTENYYVCSNRLHLNTYPGVLGILHFQFERRKLIKFHIF